MGADAPFEFQLPRREDASRIARHLLDESLAGALDAEELDTVKLLTSEVVSNAVRHGNGEITLRTELRGTRIRISVTDEGTGFEPPTTARGVNTVGRWGLAIVAAEAARWGISPGTTQVWFELDLSILNPDGGRRNH